MHFFNERKTPNDITTFIIQIIIIYILTIPISILDIKFEKYRENKNIYKKLFMIISQLFLGIIYIFILYKNFPDISYTFVDTLPGIYFAGIFFSIQYNVIISLHDIIKEKIGHII